MAEESWHSARLIPTSGISGAEEQERRATSALLAVLMAVKEFNRALLSPLGAPAGAIDCFIEVPFKLGERELRPDGLIRVRRGSKTWTALVEVKTGKNDLAAPPARGLPRYRKSRGVRCTDHDQQRDPSQPVRPPDRRYRQAEAQARPTPPPLMVACALAGCHAEGAPRCGRSRPGMDSG